MRTADTGKASLNIFWSQILFELFVERLRVRFPDLYFVQLPTEIGGSFLGAGLRQYCWCKDTSQQQSDKHSTYKAFHFPHSLCHLIALQNPGLEFPKEP